mgnify:CR=1 FL=1
MVITCTNRISQSVAAVLSPSVFQLFRGNVGLASSRIGTVVHKHFHELVIRRFEAEIDQGVVQHLLPKSIGGTDGPEKAVAVVLVSGI